MLQAQADRWALDYLESPLAGGPLGCQARLYGLELLGYEAHRSWASRALTSLLEAYESAQSEVEMRRRSEEQRDLVAKACGGLGSATSSGEALVAIGGYYGPPMASSSAMVLDPKDPEVALLDAVVGAFVVADARGGAGLLRCPDTVACWARREAELQHLDLAWCRLPDEKTDAVAEIVVGLWDPDGPEGVVALSRVMEIAIAV